MYANINDSSKRCVVITVMTTRTEPAFHGRCHRSVVVMLWPWFAPVTLYMYEYTHLRCKGLTCGIRMNAATPGIHPWQLYKESTSVAATRVQ